MIAGLPYDAEVEYLETDGACYIDTGVYLRTPLKVECDYYIPERGLKRLWGAYRQSSINCYQTNSSSSVSRGVAVAYNGTTLYLSTKEQPYFPYRATCVFEADAGNQSASAFGASVVGTNANGLTDTLNCTCGLFGNGKTGYATGENLADAGTRVYSWRCWIRGDPVSDLIPVRFTNEQGFYEGAMYDKVSGQLLRNAGTGVFVIGPDVSVMSLPVMGLHFMRRPRYTAKDYVQNGLIAMWDGIENAGWGVHDANATTWKDLVGERDFILYSVGVGDNHMVFGSNSYATASPVFQSSDMMTLEVVMDVKSATSEPCFMSFFAVGDYVGDMLWFSGGRLAWGISISQVQVKSACAIQGSATWDLSTHSFVRPNEPYKDGRAITPTSNYEYYGASRAKGLAINPTTKWTFSGDIYSIRIYSSALTAAEIARNYAVDKKRFNLP